MPKQYRMTNAAGDSIGDADTLVAAESLADNSPAGTYYVSKLMRIIEREEVPAIVKSKSSAVSKRTRKVTPTSGITGGE